MFEHQEIESLRAKLAKVCGNYIAELTRKTELSHSTVTKFFNDQKIRSECQERIFDASLEIIKSKEEKNRQRAELSRDLGITNSKPVDRPIG